MGSIVESALSPNSSERDADGASTTYFMRICVMQIMPLSITQRSHYEPDGWSQGPVFPSTSTRSPGLIRGGLDAWRGITELSTGVPMTNVQIALLTPFFAKAIKLPIEVVQRDLKDVRVHVGGLAHNAGNVATTVGRNIYVSDAAWATKLLSWEGREWLAHELTHTMQWRRLSPENASTAQSDRTFLNKYVGAFVSYDGKLSAGGFVQAAGEWYRRQKNHEPVGKISDLIHDTHPMEREAAQLAAAFVDATSYISRQS